MLKAMRSEVTRFNTEESKILEIEKTVHQLSSSLLSGRIYQVLFQIHFLLIPNFTLDIQNFLNQELEVKPLVNIGNNKEFRKEFGLNVKASISGAMTKAHDPNDLTIRSKITGICSLV